MQIWKIAYTVYLSPQRCCLWDVSGRDASPPEKCCQYSFFESLMRQLLFCTKPAGKATAADSIEKYANSHMIAFYEFDFYHTPSLMCKDRIIDRSELSYNCPFIGICNVDGHLA